MLVKLNKIACSKLHEILSFYDKKTGFSKTIFDKALMPLWSRRRFCG